MKFFILPILLILVFANFIYSQNKYIEGTVFDSESQLLELANIVLIIEKDSSVYSFATTNSEGEFNINLGQDSSYLLKVMYLGYNAFLKKINTDDLRPLEIKMVQAQKYLKEVSVVYELPIVISGDTISYKVDSFTNGKERKLKDVLKKLPGFQIDNEGQFRVHGKTVDKITIDGKDFFSGDTKMATKNIPANVVEKVNVLKNHNNHSVLREFDEQSSVGIDIRLKEDKKNILFGSVEGGGGSKERYVGHTNLFFFNPKVSMNFIGNVNNIGEQVFTYQDYFRFNGGIKRFAKKSGVVMRLSSQELGLSLLKDNKMKDTNTKVGALSFTFKPNNFLDFSGFVISSTVNNLLESNANRFYVGETLLQEQVNIFNSQNTRSEIINFVSKVTPNNKIYIEHDIVLRQGSINEAESLNSFSYSVDEFFDSNRSSRIPAIEQTLEVFINENHKNISTINFHHLSNWKKNTFNLLTDNAIYPTVFPLVNDISLNLNQSSKIITNNFEATVNHYYLINRKNHINFTTGINVNRQKLQSNIKQIINPNYELVFSKDSLGNDVVHNFEDAYLGIHYKSKIGKLTLNSGLNFHSFSQENIQQDEVSSLDKNMLLPDVHIKYNFKKSISLSLNYSIEAEFFDIQKYSQNSVLRSYNDIYQGNRILTNSWYHSFQLNYHNLNLFNFSNIYGLFSYQRKYNNVNERVIYNGIERISSAVNISDPNEVISAHGIYDKRLKKFKFELGTQISYLKNNSLFEEGLLSLNRNFSTQFSGSIEMTLDNFPVLEVGFESLINQYASNLIEKQVFKTNRPFFNVEISFLKNFILVADYEYNFYKNKNSNTSSSYDILNVELFYKKNDSPFEFKISTLNLLNTKSIRTDGYSSTLISVNEYFIQPRYLLGTINYAF